MKYILSLALITFTTFLSAQTQSAFVRTIGTLSNHGQPLSGAMVKMKGNNQQLLSGANGTLELPMHNAQVGAKYQLLNVTKKGYELADKSFLSQTFVYTEKAPLEIVMLSSEDMLREKQAIESRVLKIAENNYKKKIEALKQDQELGHISLEDYRARYKTLQEQFDTYDKIISAMAEHYARTDYDRLDSLDALINNHIINGELDQADILVAEKGNLDDRIAAYQRHATTNTIAREMLDKLAGELHEQRLAYEKERDDISNDLYNKHSIAISRFDFDTALEMLKLRADLDTTNLDAVWEYASLCYDQKKFIDSEKYNLTCLRAYITSNDIPKIASIQNNLGVLYNELHDYTNCEKFHKLALENRKLLFRQNPEAYREDMADTQDNLGCLYRDVHDYNNSEKYYKLALENREHLFLQNPKAYREDMAGTQNNLGNLYRTLHDFSNSMKYYKLALENYEQLFQLNPDAYRADMADIQTNLGNLYLNLYDYVNCEKYYKLALENREHLFLLNPDAYRANLAEIQNNLGNLYSDLHDYANCEKYYKLGLENYEQLFQQNSDGHRANVATIQNNLGVLYSDFNDYYNSEKYYKLALENKEHLFRQNPNAFRADLADTQNNLGNLYRNLRDYANSEKYFKFALENYEHLFMQNPDAFRAKLADKQNNLGVLYSDLHDYANCEKYYKLALENREYLFLQNPDVYRTDLADTQNNLGILYSDIHDYANCEKYYKLALANFELLFKQNPNAWRADIASVYWNIMLLYANTGNMEEYDKYLTLDLNHYTVLYKLQPSLYNNILIKLQNRIVWRLRVKGNINDAISLAEETFAIDESNDQSKKYLAECYNSKAYEYSNASDYVNAYIYINKAIAITPDNANIYDTKGEILLMQGKNEEALAMWKKVLQLNPDFLKDNPEGTELSNGLKKLGLIK